MKRMTIALALLWAGGASAHEFWLEPGRFQSGVPSAQTVRIQVGENFQGEHWKGSGRRRVEIRDHYQGHLKRLSLRGDHFELPGGQPGTHLLSFSNDNAFITLQAEKFNEYLRDDGLENAAEWRTQHGQEGKQGREFYRRCVKTLISQGAGGDDSTYGLDTGLPLELIPLRNPYAGKGPSALRFRLIFQHRAVARALVQVWHRGDGRTTRLQLRSDANGEVEFPCWQEGRWMVSSVHMERARPGARADWQSYWASYTFGYE